MARLFIAYGFTLLSMIVIDGIWLRLIMFPLYQRSLGHLLADSVTYWPVVVFYPLFACGLCYFVVNPALLQNESLLRTLFNGFFLGILAYGAYDLTNLATLRNWPVSIAMLDLLWGGIMCGAASMLSTWLTRITAP